MTAETKLIKKASIKQSADKLHELQRELAKAEAKVARLKLQEKDLINSLVECGSFLYHAADGFVKKVTVTPHSRLILDQKRAAFLLKKKAPYVVSAWTTVKVDWVYEQKRL